MRWFFVGVTAALVGLSVSGAAQACGCGCPGKCGGGACPCCPGPGPAGDGVCPNCPRSAAVAPSRYWDSGYGCYLYYDEGTRSSYYWSEAHRAYYPVTRSTPPVTPAAPASPTASTYGTRYYNPAP